MNKGTWIALGAALVVIIGVLAIVNKEPRTQSFTINGQPIELVRGVHEEEMPGSSSKIVTRYFGNETEADFDGDGKKDKAFIVTQNRGGSGTFFYLATTLGGEAAFLGDRIAPQSTQHAKGVVIVNYADRKPGEPMTAQPSVGVTKSFTITAAGPVEVQSGAPIGGNNGNPAGTVEAGSTDAQKCAQMGGTWSEQYKECTGIGKNSCQEIGGTFNECASACRHNPNAEACIMMCVEVCTF